ncbi:hypothetical protein [Marinobacter subterrani]|uniref:Uncharacterized protein n=1 Tax=Marinobacter subterrani TaxID=1658765 RepID=A0A0J7JF34_9GAMM|nr:hypothetical protein [Marinobacter subterrani]KMQ76396.1 hypothetical protein Msub_12609 [Marinobacter subterrani]
MKMKISVLLGLCLLVAGCGSSNIDLVKESAFIVDDTYTVAQALDGRSICSDHSWEEYEDSRGRVIVEYRCDIRGVSEYFSQTKDEVDQALSRSLGYRVQELEKEIKWIKAQLDEAPSITSEAIKQFKDTDRLESFMFVRYRFSPYDCGISSSGYSEDKVAKLRECLDEKVDLEKSTIENNEKEIAEYKQQIESKSRVVGIESATEVFKWILSEDMIYYHGGGVTLKLDDHPDIHFPYMRDGGGLEYFMERALKDTLDDQFRDYADLAESREAVPTAKAVMSKL